MINNLDNELVEIVEISYSEFYFKKCLKQIHKRFQKRQNSVGFPLMSIRIQVHVMPAPLLTSSLAPMAISSAQIPIPMAAKL